jgi:hypothetical protein
MLATAFVPANALTRLEQLAASRLSVTDVNVVLNALAALIEPVEAHLSFPQLSDHTFVGKRQDERFALTVRSPEIGLTGGPALLQVCSLAKARLLAMRLAAEAKDPNRRAR